jgi:hypothetical protein
MVNVWRLLTKLPTTDCAPVFLTGPQCSELIRGQPVLPLAHTIRNAIPVLCVPFAGLLGVLIPVNAPCHENFVAVLCIVRPLICGEPLGVGCSCCLLVLRVVLPTRVAAATSTLVTVQGAVPGFTYNDGHASAFQGAFVAF